jgi:hypothetical protein
VEPLGAKLGRRDVFEPTVTFLQQRQMALLMG